MDPNETLRRIRILTALALMQGLTDEQTQELARLVNALDEWIRKGGFFPRDWMPF